MFCVLRFSLIHTRIIRDELLDVFSFERNISHPHAHTHRSTTPQQWENFSRYNWQRAEAEIGSSQRLRESIFMTLSTVANDLDAQAQATEFALRRRLHEIEQALDELNWQKSQVFNRVYTEEFFFLAHNSI